jgi:Xaa-Pro aminopeptidase
MTVTDEPGYYLNGKFGIRIEDDLIVVDKGDGFLGFECVSLVPYDRNLIDRQLLGPQDIKFIDEYHREILDKVGPLLE